MGSPVRFPSIYRHLIWKFMLAQTIECHLPTIAQTLICLPRISSIKSYYKTDLASPCLAARHQHGHLAQSAATWAVEFLNIPRSMRFQPQFICRPSAPIANHWRRDGRTAPAANIRRTLLIGHALLLSPTSSLLLTLLTSFSQGAQWRQYFGGHGSLLIPRHLSTELSMPIYA